VIHKARWSGWRGHAAFDVGEQASAVKEPLGSNAARQGEEINGAYAKRAGKDVNKVNEVNEI